MTLKLNQWRAYFDLMRINKPIGIFLLLWPTYCGLWLANRGLPDFFILLIFTMGALLMRTAGCVINDFVDRKFDGYVARTSHRPFPKGSVTEKEAKALFLLLIIIAFILVLTLNQMVLWLSIIGMLLVCIYPFIKRFSSFPQIILGLAFSLPIPMAYAEICNHLPLECWLLFMGNIIWSIIYDTQYSMVDRSDDIKIGIKSTAIIFSHFDTLIIGILQLIMVLILFYLGLYLDFKLSYFISLVIILGLFIYQQKLIYNRQPRLCFQAFMNNNYVGMVLFVGILLNNY